MNVQLLKTMGVPVPLPVDGRLYYVHFLKVPVTKLAFKSV